MNIFFVFSTNIVDADSNSPHTSEDKTAPVLVKSVSPQKNLFEYEFSFLVCEKILIGMAGTPCKFKFFRDKRL